MSKSKITITFTEKEEAGDIVSFKARKLTGNFEEILLYEKYQTDDRDSIGEAEVSSGSDLTVTTLNYLTWLNEDYNQDELFSISSDGSLTNVVVEINDPLWEFYDVQDNDGVTFLIENSSCDDFMTTNDDDFFIESDIDPNTTFKLNVVFNNQDKIGNVKKNKEIVVLNQDSNSYSETLLRGVSYNFEFLNQDKDCNKFISGINKYFLIQSFTLNDFDIISRKVINETQVHIIYKNNSSINYDLEIEFSEDNVSWQSSNIFLDQPEGLKTFYIRDNLGGSLEINFFVDSYGTRQSYSFLSKALTFDFKLIEVGGCIGNNSNNTFEKDSRNLLPYCDEQLINRCDEITIQFKSNYRSNNLQLTSESGLFDIIPLNKKTNNLNQFKSLDCFEYKYSENESAIYFSEGNEYSESGNIIGYSSLLGNLPDFAEIGNYILLNDFYYYIKNIFYEESINKNVIIINKQNIGDYEERLTKISCYYDILNYEVYQADVDLSNKVQELYDLTITKEDESNGSIVYQTENFELKDSHENTVGIVYYNDNDKDIFYSFGIRNFLRLKCRNQYAYIKNDNEININDEKVTVISSDVNEGDKYIFEDLNRNLAIKSIIALSSDNVFINGIGYAKNQSINIDNIENTNISKIEAELLHNGDKLQTTTSKSYSGGFTADSTITADSTRTADES